MIEIGGNNQRRRALFVDLGGSFGLSDSQTRECIHDALAATSSYTERVAALDRVPARQRQQLVEIARHERLLLEKHGNTL